jgi:transposase, IS30 family
MKHLTQVQRYEINAYLLAGKKQVFIAQQLCVSKSCISREITRNADLRNGSYKPELAQRKADERKKFKHKKECFTLAMRELATDLLTNEQYSPEQIVGYCKNNAIPMVSHERLYQWVWNDKKRKGTLHTHLRRKGRKYRKRGNAKDTRGIIKDRVHISKRPAVVDLKERFGDLEFDTVIGQNHQRALLTINDRATSMVWIKLLSGKQAEPLTQNTIEALVPYKGLIYTGTADNGKEFAFHKKIAESLAIDFYFATPYHSWERGANENTNGLIRQYFPKGSDFKNITHEQVLQVQDKLNNRPRKRLGFMTPNQKFLQLISQVQNDNKISNST